MNHITKITREILHAGLFLLALLLLGRLLMGPPRQVRAQEETPTETPTSFLSFYFPDVSNPPYTPTPTRTPTSTPVPTATKLGPKSMLVDISEQRLWAYEGGMLAYEFPVSTGVNNSTLTGSFTILDKERNAWSGPWGFWMPYWMGIYYVGYNLENGMHGLPVYPNGTEIWRDKIGTPVSYGCVVLVTEAMRQIYEWAPIGTPLKIQK